MKRASGVPLRGVAGAWRVAPRSFRLRVATLAIFAIALSGIGASSALALDFVWLNNQTSVPFTQESLCLFVDYLECPAEWKEGAVLAAGQSNPGISLVLQVVGVTPAHVTTTWYPSGISGHFTFTATDPALSPAFVQCYGDVPGFTCTVVHQLFAYLQTTGSASSGLLGSSSSPVEARFWSGLAPVSRGGIALVPVASYSTRQHGTARERVVLRSASGEVIGRGEKAVHFGARANIQVQLTPRVARAVARGASIKVRASVTHADKTAGTGQAANSLVLTRLTPTLGHLLQLPAG